MASEKHQVVVVGAGFAGASTAFHLSQLGFSDVVILEQETAPGYHASGRNAALARQLTGHDETTKFTVPGAAFLRQPKPGFCELPLVSVHGAFYPVDSEAELERWYTHGQDWDVYCEKVTPKQVVARWPELAGVSMVGALSVPSDGIIDIHALLHSYLSQASQSGIKVRYKTKVDSIMPSQGGLQLNLHDGDTIEAAVVVNAAGPWAGQLAQQDSVLESRKRHLFICSKLEDVAKPRPFVWHVGANEFYLRDELEDILLCGCDESIEPPGDARVSMNVQDWIADKMASIVPAFGDLTIKRAWAGLRTFSKDSTFEIGWDQGTDNLLWVGGLGGHGATSSHAVGELAATKVATRLGTRLA